MTKTARRIIIITIIFATLYAILRYHLFKGVAWSHFPLFIMNKIISFSGFILLVASLALEPLSRNKGETWLLTRKFLGRTGLILIIIHIIVSFLLFRPEVYDKFFAADGSLNLIGELSMLAGTLGIAAYLIMHNTYSKPEGGNAFQKMVMSPSFGVTALTLSALHIAIMGFEGWMTPLEWPGGMPSISLVSLSAFLVGIVTFLAGQSNTQSK
jgi:DMSO/TMAO reductase YedYZ heme-binding membrane subunit